MLRICLPIAVVALSLSPLAAPASAASCPNSAVKSGQISKGHFSDAVECLINKQRSAHGLAKLHHSDQLRAGARAHNGYMLRRNCFEHECPGEDDLATRLEKSGYLTDEASWIVGENIAWAAGEKLATPQGLVRAWMHSPEHRANILNRKFKDSGVWVGWDSPAGSYPAPVVTATQDFGGLD